MYRLRLVMKRSSKVWRFIADEDGKVEAGKILFLYQAWTCKSVYRKIMDFPEFSFHAIQYIKNVVVVGIVLSSTIGIGGHPFQPAPPVSLSPSRFFVGSNLLLFRNPTIIYIMSSVCAGFRLYNTHATIFIDFL